VEEEAALNPVSVMSSLCYNSVHCVCHFCNWIVGHRRRWTDTRSCSLWDRCSRKVNKKSHGNSRRQQRSRIETELCAI